MAVVDALDKARDAVLGWDILIVRLATRSWHIRFCLGEVCNFEKNVIRVSLHTDRYDRIAEYHSKPTIRPTAHSIQLGHWAEPPLCSSININIAPPKRFVLSILFSSPKARDTVLRRKRLN